MIEDLIGPFPKLTPEELKRIQDLELKKTKRRHRRLKQIIGELEDELKELVPQDFANYRLTYQEIKEHIGIFGEPVPVPPSQAPAFGIFLAPREEPERKYSIMHLFREDVDKRLPKRDIPSYYQIPSFKANLTRGIEALKEKTE